jgi:hypothetical protein
MAAMAPTLLQILVTIPAKLPRVVALCLDVPKKETAIRDDLKARQAIKIVREFITQNEITELLQDFFGLMGDLGINQETPEEAQLSAQEEAMETLENLKTKQEELEQTKAAKKKKLAEMESNQE